MRSPESVSAVNSSSACSCVLLHIAFSSGVPLEMHMQVACYSLFARFPCFPMAHATLARLASTPRAFNAARISRAFVAAMGWPFSARQIVFELMTDLLRAMANCSLMKSAS